MPFVITPLHHFIMTGKSAQRWGTDKGLDKGGGRALAAGADMPTMIAAGQHLVTRSKKRQSARVPRDQTLSAAQRPICPLINPLVWGIAWSTSCAGAGRRAGSRRSAARQSRCLRLPIAARRPSHRYPLAERVQNPPPPRIAPRGGRFPRRSDGRKRVVKICSNGPSTSY
jgi:hypothetical protein